ncbi:hypothetical protein ACWKWK_17345 [Pseudoxanthomonas beigongshangi]
MKIKCLSISGEHVPYLQRNDGESSQTDYRPFKIGSVYSVFGMMLGRNGVRVLACPDTNGPSWIPLSLVEIVDPSLPSGMDFYDVANGQRFRWLADSVFGLIGYPELVESEDHFIGLMERKEEDLAIFYARYPSGLLS